MIICSKCGASNGAGTVECRMCANPLAQHDAANSGTLGLDSLHTTVVINNLKTQQQQGTTGLMECLICPECQTINQLAWSFCPQCGKNIDTSFLHVMERPDQAPTLEATRAPDPETVQIPLQAVAPKIRSEEAQHAAENRAHLAALPQQPAEWPPDPKPRQPGIPEPPVQHPKEQASGAAKSSNGAADKEPNASPPAIEDKPIACTECGSDNSSDYSFCLNCGASLPVTKTVVMASIASSVKPRLRLLVQGEVSGPTYEIKNEATIGRTEGSITFPRDGFMSSSHARIVKRGADFMLIDEASSNGTFMKVKGEAKLEPGDVILVGGQLLRFET